MKKVLVVLVAILTIGSAFCQDTIVTINKEEIVAFNLKPSNVPTSNQNVWVKGYYYNSESGERLNIKASEVLDIKMSLNQKVPTSLVVKETKKSFNNNLNLGGYYIEKGAKLKNTSIVMNLIAAGICGLALTQEEPGQLIVVGGVISLVSLPINIMGNSKIAKGGRLIKKFN